MDGQKDIVMMTLNSLIKKIRKIIKEHYRLVLTIMFSLFAIILYGSISNHNNIWYDEAYQLILNENSLINIIKYVARDFHVPFYAVLLKITTTIFGSSPFVGRMVSLSAIICCFILSFYKIKDLFSLKTSIIFSCCLLSLSCFYFSSIEIRPYSYPMFFTLASSVYMISIIKNKDKKSWILYTLFSILSMYSHNIAMIYIFCSNIIFLIYLLFTNRRLIKYYFFSFISISLGVKKVSSYFSIKGTPKKMHSVFNVSFEKVLLPLPTALPAESEEFVI